MKNHQKKEEKKNNHQKKEEKKKNHQNKEILKIATYNVRTLSKDEHVQELEEELKETNIKWDVIGLGEIRRKEEGFTSLQSGHLLYNSNANNGRKLRGDEHGEAGTEKRRMKLTSS